MEYGKEYKTTRILVNGKTPKLMDTGSILGQMEIGMKVSGTCV